MPAVDTLFSQLRLGKKSKLLSAQTVCRLSSSVGRIEEETRW